MKSNITRTRLISVGYIRVDPSLLDDSERQVFLCRKHAVELKLDGVVGAEIKKTTGIAESELSRFMKRYTEVNDDGLFWGEAALIPHFRLVPYERRKALGDKRTEQQGGLAGVLSYTLAKKPNISHKFLMEVLRLDLEYGHGSPFNKKQLCNVFYDICRSEGLGDEDWPFNQPRAANRTINTYIDKLLCSDFQKGALASGGPISLIHSKTGSGYSPLLENFDVYDFIEIDSYYADAFFVLNISGDRRIKSKDVISRIWIIAAICRKSNAILAIKFVFSSEIRSQDLADLICEAFTGRWTPRQQFSVRDLKYSDAAGMPGYCVPRLRFHVWGAICVDNAMQHHANKIYELVLHRLGTSLNFGPLGQPARRPNVERLFHRIASNVMHQIPSTTGSSPEDGRAEQPEKAAIYYQIDVDEALEVMDVYTANYNGTPQGGKCKANSPLEILRNYCSDKRFFFPLVSESYLNTVTLGSLAREATVTGSVEKGNRPRIKLDQAIYTSPALASAGHMIGKKLIVRIQPNDYREVEAYLADGTFFGLMTVEAAWRGIAHSVTTRKLINRALSKREFEIVEGQNPVLAWRKHLTANANPSNIRELKRLLDEADAGGSGQPTLELNSDDGISRAQSISSERWKDLDIFN